MEHLKQAQQGPWELDEFGNIVDTNGHTIKLSGTVFPDPDDADEVAIAHANKQLILEAPTMNYLLGTVLEIMDNPYSTDNERVQGLYEIVEEIRQAHNLDISYESF